jgi:hypothetical protein
MMITTTDNMIWQFMIPHIKHLQSLGNTVECVCSKTGFWFDELRDKFGFTMHEIDFERSPLKLKNIKAYKKLKQLQKERNFDLIYCQQPVGGLMGRLIGKKFKIPVIYTAHGFHFFKGNSKIKNIIFKTIEKHYAKYTTALITINDEDYAACQKWKSKKKYKINGIGVDLTKYCINENLNKSSMYGGLSDIKGVEWLRLHYAYPTQFPYEILDVMNERENVCNYLDLALQHSSDNMLKYMRRGITYNQTIDLLSEIRTKVPDICLRTTLMVGHPNETEEDFDHLLNFVREQKFERMGAFMYSNEEGTYADKHYEDNVPDEVKRERLDTLMMIQQGISWDANQKLVGRKEKIIIDRVEGDYYVGRTQYDSPDVDTECLVKRDDVNLELGNFYQAEIVKAEEFDLYAKVIS